MPDPVAFLQERICCQQIPRVIVPRDTFQAPVFPVLRFPAFQNRESDLNVGIIHLVVPEDEVAFQFSDLAHADHIVFARCVRVNDVFKGGAEIDPVIRIQSIVERKIRKLVLFFTL